MARNEFATWAEQFEALPRNHSTIPRIIEVLGELGIAQDLPWYMPRFVTPFGAEESLEVRQAVPLLATESRHPSGHTEITQLRVHNGQLQGAYTTFIVPQGGARRLGAPISQADFRRHYLTDTVMQTDVHIGGGPIPAIIGRFIDGWLEAPEEVRIPNALERKGK